MALDCRIEYNRNIVYVNIACGVVCSVGAVDPLEPADVRVSGELPLNAGKNIIRDRGCSQAIEYLCCRGEPDGSAGRDR